MSNPLKSTSSLVVSVVGLVLFTLSSHGWASLYVDDFEQKSQRNLLGGGYYVISDPAASVIEPATSIGFASGQDSASALGFSYRLKRNANSVSYVGVVTALSPSQAAVDLSAYAGVRFWARGTGNLRVGIVTSDVGPEHNNFEYGIAPDDDYNFYEIPFSSCVQVFGTRVAWNPAHVTHLAFSITGYDGDSGSIAIDDIELYSEETTPVAANPVLLEPKVNQIGYLSDAPKFFTITESATSPRAPFQVVTTSGAVAFEGNLSSQVFDETVATGERVFQGEFSSLEQEGRFAVLVGDERSAPFTIGRRLYDNVYHDAIRAFYLIRSGIAIDDSATGVSHAASHTMDALLDDGSEVRRDFVGGWYNAGDFGKWTHMAAISSSLMMWLYELRPEARCCDDLDIPESRDSVPDLLDQARWGLSWLLKMQNDDGSVMHKVDTEPYFAIGKRPDQDPNERFARGVSSIDAGSFVGVMRQAGRVFENFEPSFAATCRAAAERSWRWLRSNPSVTYKDQYYSDNDPSQEALWALAETVRETDDASLAQELTEALKTTTVPEVHWKAPQVLGIFAVGKNSQGEEGSRQAAKDAIVLRADALLALAAPNGNGVAMTAAEFRWGSNETVLHRAGLFIFAFELTNDLRYQQAALRQLDYILGNNSLSQSFVCGHGTRTPQHPYHFAYLAEKVVLPGWVVGGPNGGYALTDTALMAVQNRGTPPAKCWVDQGDFAGSYASNEGQTTENAALAFVAGYFASSEEKPPIARDPETDVTPKSSHGGCSCAMGRSESQPIPWFAMVSLFVPALCLRTRSARRLGPRRSEVGDWQRSTN